jgi:hypothetical protein
MKTLVYENNIDNSKKYEVDSWYVDNTQKIEANSWYIDNKKSEE